MLNLLGKNYIFTLTPTFHPVAESGCMAAASKTRKNIIITLQVCIWQAVPPPVLTEAVWCLVWARYRYIGCMKSVRL